MTSYDNAILAFYFVFMLAVGLCARRMVHNVSDYFRSGGQVLWWMAGGSAFMLTFSAWTFTGAASRAYLDGWPIIVLFVANAGGFAGAAFYFAPRIRQMRVITSMQMVRMRFSPANEQFFTMMNLVMRLFDGGIWLWGLGVFFAAAFDKNLTATILVCGGTVITITMLGGSWAVVASDFVLVLVLVPVTMVASALAIHRLGGPASFFHALSTTHLNVGKIETQRFLPLWCVSVILMKFVIVNNPGDTPKYICVKDSGHARKAALLACVLTLVGSVFFFIPPLAAAVMFPDLHAVFPGLKNPGEGSFFAVAAATFPGGMTGLLVSGVFAATMSAMNGGLNTNAGIFIKNVYQPLLRRNAAERELLLAGKIATAVMGAGIMTLAHLYSRFPHLSLFQMMMDFGVLVTLPYAMPLFLGLVIKRTPAWAGWSTVLVGFAAGLAARYALNLEWAWRVFGASAHPGPWELQNWSQASTVILDVGVATAWFALSTLFYRGQSEEHRSRIEAFTSLVSTRVDFEKEEGPATDDRQSWLIGWLCLPYGAVIGLMALIPNPILGRLSFVFCSLVLLAIGTALVTQTRRQSTP